MKLDQQELEIMCLSALIKFPKCMDKLITRGISGDHFEYQGQNDKTSYTRALFMLFHNYWIESGGSLFTSYVLESKFQEYKVGEKTKVKLLTLWSEVEDTDVNENDFYEITSQLKNKYCLRLLSKMLSDGYEQLNSNGLDESLKVIQKNLDQIQEQKNEIGGDKHSFDVAESSTFFETEYDKRLNHPDLYKGIECGISNIDDKTFGWLPGQIVVFLAPSSGGKSVMLLNSAIHANKKCGKKVLYMSFEMNSWLCLLRHVSLSYEIPYSQIKGNTLSPDEKKKIIDGLKSAEDGPYFEYDVNMEDPTPEYIDSKIRDLIATKGKPDLLVVDYIGNMTVRNPGPASKDWELQSKAIQQLFIMAKRYNIPIITAQQINRETIRDSRKSKENNKFMSYDQAAASGGQNLMHLCTYAIAMEPNREKGYCILHPVKMRDAFFNPFPIAMDPEYNKVREMDKEEQEQIMGLHQMSNGATTISKPATTETQLEKIPMKKHTETNEEEEMFIVPDEDDDEIQITDWVLS